MPRLYRREIHEAIRWMILGKGGMPRPYKRQGKRKRLIGSSSRLAVLRVPVALQVGDQSGAEMAVSLLARVDGKIGAKGVERLLPNPQRAPVPCRTHYACRGQSPHHPIHPRT